MMKTPTKFIALLSGAALLASSAFAQGVVTNPVGYVTVTVNGSPDGVQTAFTSLAAPMENGVEAAGSTTVEPTSAVLTNSGAAYGAGAYAGTDASGNSTHYLQIATDGGASDGLILDIIANTETTVTTGADLTGLVSSGDAYVIKKHVTLADVFGAENTAGLKSGGDSASSDLVYVMSSDGLGVYVVYYYQTDSLGFLGGDGWRVLGDSATDMSNVVVGPDDGVIVARKGVGDLSFTVSGSVNGLDHQRGLPAGYSLVSYPFPVDVTLDDSGIYTSTNGYVSGGDSASSDLVYFLQADGSFDIFYRQTDSLGFLGGDGWRLLGDSSTEKGLEVVSAGSSVIIYHTGTGLQWADAKPF
ncbi:MAG: hypothetical protein ACI9JZ_001508 [Lentimonas sp.]|jgi:hypothetical protein